MICIPFSLTFAAITALWVFTRAAICFRRNRFSLKRELQLPFYVRCSDIDDLILNCAGYLMGYGIYLLVKALRQRR